MKLFELDQNFNFLEIWISTCSKSTESILVKLAENKVYESVQLMKPKSRNCSGRFYVVAITRFRNLRILDFLKILDLENFDQNYESKLWIRECSNLSETFFGFRRPNPSLGPQEPFGRLKPKKVALGFEHSRIHNFHSPIIHVHTKEGIMNDLNSIWNLENEFISAK
jgi:hypothetical protein